MAAIDKVSGIIKVIPTSNNLNEISQSLCMKFAFLNKDYVMVHEPVKCRDFIHDIVRGNLNNDPIDKYGLVYNTKDNPTMCMDRTVMFVQYPNGEKPNLEVAYNLLKTFEDFYLRVGSSTQAGTRIYPLQETKVNGGECVVFSSPQHWQSAPALISLFTLLIKLAQHPEVKTISGSESSINSMLDVFVAKGDKLRAEGKSVPTEVQYVKTIRSLLHLFMKNYTNVFEFDSKSGYAIKAYTTANINKFHDNYGICGHLSGATLELPALDLLEKLGINNKKKTGLPIITNGDESVKAQIRQFCSSLSQSGTFVGFVMKGKEKNTRYISTVPVMDSCISLNQVVENIKTNKKTVDMDKLRLCIMANPTVIPKLREKLFYAKSLINKMEGVLGLDAPSKISSAHLADQRQGLFNAYLITGSSFWMQSPYALHILLNVLRNVMMSYTPYEQWPEIKNGTVADTIKNVIAKGSIGYNMHKTIDVLLSDKELYLKGKLADRYKLSIAQLRTGTSNLYAGLTSKKKIEIFLTNKV